MRYKNIKTGFIFETNGHCEGADYILLEEEKEAPKSPKKAPKKKEKK